MAYTMETKNGGIIDFELVSPTSGELRKCRSLSRYTKNGGVILQEETMVLHGRCTYFQANSCDRGEKSFQEEACDNDDEDDEDEETTTAGWQVNKNT